jgi:hypothetical protein
LQPCDGARHQQLTDVCDVELACLRVSADETTPSFVPPSTSMSSCSAGTLYPIAVRPTMTCRVAHDLTPLLQADAPTRPDLDRLPAPIAYAAYRRDPAGAVVLARIGAAHEKVLMLCDGHMTPADLTGQLFGIRHSVRAERAVARALEGLAAVGLVAFLDSPICQDQPGTQWREPPNGR